MITEIRPDLLEQCWGLAYDYSVPEALARRELQLMTDAPWAFGRVGVSEEGKVLSIKTGIALAAAEYEAFLASDEVFIHPFLATQPQLLRRTWHDIGRMNAAGLVLFIGHFSFHPSLTEADRVTEAVQLTEAFIEHFAGLNIAEVVIEVTAADKFPLAEQAGFRPVSLPSHQARPQIFSMNRETAANRQHMQLLRLFGFRKPQIQFSAGEGEILHLARVGYSDTEIREKLGLKKPPLDAAWQRIFRKFESIQSFSNRRDRRQVISFLRAYPWELWPFDVT